MEYQALTQQLALLVDQLRASTREGQEHLVQTLPQAVDQMLAQVNTALKAQQNDTRQLEHIRQTLSILRAQVTPRS